MSDVPHGMDPRVAHTRAVVLDATVAILAEDGFERLTVEAVAERSGVARSTIYRNWPERNGLLSDAFVKMCAFSEIPDLGSVEAELRYLGEELATGLGGAAWSQALPSLVGAAHHDPTLTAAQQRFSDVRRAGTAAIFERARDRGELVAGADPGRLAEFFVSGFFFRFLMIRRPIDDAFVDEQVAAVVALATGTSPGAQR